MKLPIPTEGKRPSLLVNGMLREYTTETEYVLERYMDGVWVDVIRNKLEMNQSNDRP